MSQRVLTLVATVLIAACSGAATSSAQTVSPQAGSEAAVQGFLRAVADSNLHGAEYRIISNARDGSSDDRRVLQVEMSRRGCDKIVPFTTTRSRKGWVISAIDLDMLGSPGRQCGEADSTSAQ
jgi:hypothetical protein